MNRVGIVVLLAALWISPELVRAQEVLSLEDVEEMARLGRSEEARVALLGWWEAERTDASRRDLQRAMWLRGTLTVDPALAALDFRRLVIEYPGGPFSDQALLRLAQAAHASGDGDAAQRYVGTLTRDYPGSPVRREAEAWLASAGPVPDPPLQIAEADSVAPQPSVEEVASIEPTPAESTPTEPATQSVDGARRFAVQLGAFADIERARALLRRAADAGLEPRLVRLAETRLVHVRVGVFDSAAPASDLLRRIGGMGFVAALVRDADKEERIGR